MEAIRNIFWIAVGRKWRHLAIDRLRTVHVCGCTGTTVNTMLAYIQHLLLVERASDCDLSRSYVANTVAMFQRATLAARRGGCICGQLQQPMSFRLICHHYQEHGTLIYLARLRMR